VCECAKHTCLCVCITKRKKEKERERKREKENMRVSVRSILVCVYALVCTRMGVYI